jgi:maleylacetoacetate isomerase
MKLYSFFNSSASFRVRIALELKGIDYEFVGVDIRSGEQSSDEYLGTVSPSPLVPALEDGDIKISQSMAIMDYLDIVVPEPRLLPKNTKERMRELEFANIIACDTHPLNNLRILKYFNKDLGLDADTVQTWYQHWVDIGLGAAETMLQAREKPARYCFFDVPSLADCVLIPQIANALRKGCDVSAFPACTAVYEYAMSQEAFQQAAPEAQPDYIAP